MCFDVNLLIALYAASPTKINARDRLLRVAILRSGQGLGAASVRWPHIPDAAIVAYTSSIPRNDIWIFIFADVLSGALLGFEQCIYEYSRTGYQALFDYIRTQVRAYYGLFEA